MPWKLFFLLLLFGGSALCSSGQLLTERTMKDSSDLSTSAESRQLGMLGFTALGVMMFPILVSLGMASFVSHLPTVFKELASEFGIPATPPRKFFLFRRNFPESLVNDYNHRWNPIMKGLQRSVIQKYGDRRLALKFLKDLGNNRNRK